MSLSIFNRTFWSADVWGIFINTSLCICWMNLTNVLSLCWNVCVRFSFLFLWNSVSSFLPTNTHTAVCQPFTSLHCFQTINPTWTNLLHPLTIFTVHVHACIQIHAYGASPPSGARVHLQITELQTSWAPCDLRPPRTSRGLTEKLELAGRRRSVFTCCCYYAKHSSPVPPPPPSPLML